MLPPHGVLTVSLSWLLFLLHDFSVYVISDSVTSWHDRLPHNVDEHC